MGATVRQMLEEVDAIGQEVLNDAAALRQGPSSVQLMMIAQRFRVHGVTLADLERKLAEGTLARSTDPRVLILAHRVQVARRVLHRVSAAHVDALAEGTRFLRAGDPGEDPRPRIRHRVRIVAGGAVGQGRRR